MERFAAVFVKIQNLNPEVALHSMLMALKPNPFVDSLCRKPLNDMDDLRARAIGYIQMEEHAEFREKMHAKPTNGNSTGQKEKLKVSNEAHFKRSHQGRGPRYDFYTSLNTSCVHILDEVANTDLISLPPPGHTPTNVDKSKHCRNRHKFGHTIEEFWTLRDKIEELTQASHLGQYVHRSQAQRGGHSGRGRERRRGYHSRNDQASRSRPNTEHVDQPEPKLEPNQAPLRGVINIIVGEFAGGGASNSARKRHLRSVNHVQSRPPPHKPKSPPITFTDEDYADINPNQDEPIVISIEVANWTVQKTLID
ncbi:uncharacterized protein LOC109818829 [Cajanus cajan]|uniref:uncharacterized protein LOC109818829 n=1 Tax=Cajanus cajan TaxID=3821 RepID=UPI00098DD242|nr:uncharacterized protein LOC109818829 [Cajanus cajan]